MTVPLTTPLNMCLTVPLTDAWSGTAAAGRRPLRPPPTPRPASSRRWRRAPGVPAWSRRWPT
jgi:hypothetical protein